MAAAVVCDRCGYVGIEDVDMNEFRHIRIHELQTPIEYFDEAKDSCDICDKCYNQLFGFIDSKF